MSLRIGIVAGEPSGDRLGAGLLQALRELGSVDAVGVGGQELTAVGLELIAPMADLTMNGFVEPLRRLPSLWRLLRTIEQRVVAAQVDLFVGVDFNVFNLLLERRLKRRGIKTVHYVSPSVYAWRRGRINRMARSADLLLTLFPFEPALYAGQPLRTAYVGHPLADEIAQATADPSRRNRARAGLGVPAEDLLIALMPGSRRSELRFMLAPFLGAAQAFARTHPDARFIVPCATPVLADLVRRELRSTVFANLPIKVVEGRAREALAASDAALVKSGTSTLEAMLLGVPMVVCYRLGLVSYQIVKRLIRTPFIALPNILAQRALVPELVQDALQPELLAAELERQLSQDSMTELRVAYSELHKQLSCNANRRAAAEVRGLLDLGGEPGDAKVEDEMTEGQG